MRWSRLPAVQALGGTERGMIENAHGLSFENWAAMWGLAYMLISEPGDNRLSPGEEDVVIEVRPDGAESEAFWAALNGGTEG